MTDTITPDTPEEYTLSDVLARVRELTHRADIETKIVTTYRGSGCTRRLLVAGETVGPEFHDWSSGITRIGGCSMDLEARGQEGQPAEDVAQALALAVKQWMQPTKTIQTPTPGRVVLFRTSIEYNLTHNLNLIVDGLDQEVVPAIVMRHYGEGRVQLAPLGYNALFTARHGSDSDGIPLMACWCYPPRSEKTVEVPIPPQSAERQG